MELETLLQKIAPLNQKTMEQAKKRWDSLAKPLHSLGLLEDALVKIAGMTDSVQAQVSRRAVVVMCADNGVVEEGVTQCGSEVTAIVAENLTRNATSVTRMAEAAHTDVIPVDAGMITDLDLPGIRRCKTSYGTKNFLKAPAMTREEAVQVIQAGIDLVGELKAQGYHILATGEMGIGNTTTSSAMAAVLLDRPVEEVTGRGAGLSSKGLERKIEVIRQGIALHHPDPNDPLDVLQKVGGFDIAGMTGLFLGGAVHRIPVVIDGFISGISALTALRLCPQARDFMLPSHVSKEPAGKMLLDALEMKPFLTCEMCLGEGTGAVALFSVLDLAHAVYTGMSTFADTEIEEYKPLD
ncbi:MAG: nicotinate-nucleotide--dimethylbenzimidazole phosphoribosyltransferase [Massiliimalia sp.]